MNVHTLCLLGVVLFSSCSAFDWAQRDPPQGSATTLRGLTFYVYGDLSLERRANLVKALDEAVGVLADPEFDALVVRAGVAHRDIIDGYATGHCELENQTVAGEGLAAAVLDAVRAAPPSVSAWPNGHEFLPGTSAIATARRLPTPAISIDPERVDQWRGDVGARSCLIDTLVHEMSHLVVRGDGETAYVDDRRSGRPYMVSYRLGRLAACFYRRARGSRGDVDTCIEASLVEPSCPSVRR